MVITMRHYADHAAQETADAFVGALRSEGSETARRELLELDSRSAAQLKGNAQKAAVNGGWWKEPLGSQDGEEAKASDDRIRRGDTVTVRPHSPPRGVIFIDCGAAFPCLIHILYFHRS